MKTLFYFLLYVAVTLSVSAILSLQRRVEILEDKDNDMALWTAYVEKTLGELNVSREIDKESK